jgi:hypothetical protein
MIFVPLVKLHKKFTKKSITHKKTNFKPKQKTVFNFVVLAIFANKKQRHESVVFFS